MLINSYTSTWALFILLFYDHKGVSVLALLLEIVQIFMFVLYIYFLHVRSESNQSAYNLTKYIHYNLNCMCIEETVSCIYEVYVVATMEAVA